MENEIYLLAAWFMVMMMVGVVIEIRVFSELIGYMALAVGLILYHRFPALQTSRSEFAGTEALCGLERFHSSPRFITYPHIRNHDDSEYP